MARLKLVSKCLGHSSSLLPCSPIAAEQRVSKPGWRLSPVTTSWLEFHCQTHFETEMQDGKEELGMTVSAGNPSLLGA